MQSLSHWPDQPVWPQCAAAFECNAADLNGDVTTICLRGCVPRSAPIGDLQPRPDGDRNPNWDAVLRPALG